MRRTGTDASIPDAPRDLAGMAVFRPGDQIDDAVAQPRNLDGGP